MSSLFGAFWKIGATPSAALCDALEQLASRAALPIHRFDHAVIFAPQNAVAANDHAILSFSGELRNQAELAKDAQLPADTPAAAMLLALLAKRSLDELLQDLNGPFAIAYYDLARKCFHLVRDQLGQRFLFHATLPLEGCTIFAEQLPELLALPQISRELDDDAIADYLSLGYIPAPRTAYAAIAKVAPGTDDAGDGATRPAPRRYWRPQFLPQRQITWEDAVAEARRLLEQATRRLLQAHPTADVMLSGGIDSGVVAGVAGDLAPDDARRAYTIAFAESAYDESDLAAGTARRCGVPLQVHRLSPADLPLLETALSNAGEPYADSSLLPTAAATRDTARDALFTGDGGDEVFGGYRRYQAMLLRSRIPAWLQLLLRLPCRAAAALLPNPRDNRARLANLKRSLHSLALPPTAAYGSFQQIASRELRSRLLAKRSSQDYLAEWQRLADDLPLAHPVQRYNALDLMVYLPDDGFRKTNLAATGTNVSYLCPILDMEVVRFALSLPLEYRFNSKENKRILRHIGKDFLDPRILSTPKRGFGTPIADWFRNDLAPVARKLAAEAPEWDKHNILNASTLKQIVSEHLQGSANHGSLLWTLYCLRLWEEHQPG